MNWSVKYQNNPLAFWLGVLSIALIGMFLIPPLVLAACSFRAGFSFSETISTLIQQYQTDRRNLALVGIPSILPFGLLAAVLAFYRRRRGAQGSIALAFGGGVPILLVLIWAHASVWPLFLPGRPFPGWPHGMELVIAPIFFAPVAMTLGLVTVGIWLRHR